MTRSTLLQCSRILAALALALPVRAETPLRQVIDAEMKAVWQREKITPAGRADDTTFLRCIYIDLVGTIPTIDETRQFLKDGAPDKRSKLIDRLLKDPRYATHMADIWLPILISRSPAHPEVQQQHPVLYKWLMDKFARNLPYDRWVRELLQGEGNTAEDGPPLFYVQFNGRVEETAVAVSRIFLGTQIQWRSVPRSPAGQMVAARLLWPGRVFRPAQRGRRRCLQGQTPSGYSREEHRRGAVHGPGCQAAAGTEGHTRRAEVPRRRRFEGAGASQGLQRATGKSRSSAAQATLLAQGKTGRLAHRGRQPFLRQSHGQPPLGAVHGSRPFQSR